jgi:predicted amidohydrolase
MNHLSITLIQADLVWENVTANLINFDRLLSSINQPTDIILLPEMFTTGFTMNAEKTAETMNGKTMQWLALKASILKVMMIGSFIVKEKNQYFNRLVLMRPNCSFEYYDKRHLFGMAGEDKIFSAGKERLVIDYKGWKICPMVCYDLRFPVWARNKNDYDLLIYIANWPAPRIMHWQTLLKARAIENQSFTVGLNRIGTDENGLYYSGNSTVIMPDGMTIFESEHEEKVIRIKLSKSYLEKTRTNLPFLQDSDTFSISE